MSSAANDRHGATIGNDFGGCQLNRAIVDGCWAAVRVGADENQYAVKILGETSRAADDAGHESGAAAVHEKRERESGVIDRAGERKSAAGQRADGGGRTECDAARVDVSRKFSA